MTEHDNIYKIENDKYAVRIQRRIDGKRLAIAETYLTLEEAIAARDEILRKFEASGKLQHSKDRRARRLARAIRRFGTDNIVEIKANDVSDRTVFVKRAECEICGADISRSHYFRDSTTRCRKCITAKDSDHQRRMQQSRLDRVESNKNNSIGVKKHFLQSSSSEISRRSLSKRRTIQSISFDIRRSNSNQGSCIGIL